MEYFELKTTLTLIWHRVSSSQSNRNNTIRRIWRWAFRHHIYIWKQINGSKRWRQICWSPEASHTLETWFLRYEWAIHGDARGKLGKSWARGENIYGSLFNAPSKHAYTLFLRIKNIMNLQIFRSYIHLLFNLLGRIATDKFYFITN